jgi:hypothetical protein
VTTPNPDVAYDEAVRLIGSSLEQLRTVWNEIVAGVNQALGIIPGLMEVFNQLVEPWHQAVDWLWRLYTEHGDANAVRQVATSWNEVFGTVSGQAGALDRSQLGGTGHWKGTAADQYLTVVNNQRAALTDAAAVTESVSRILNEIADAQRNFMVAIAGATAVFVGAVIAAWAGGPLAGVLGDIAAVAVFAAALATLVANYENTLDSKKNELDQKNRLGTSFPNGAWPSAVTPDMSDATVKDGDASEWEVS